MMVTSEFWLSLGENLVLYVELMNTYEKYGSVITRINYYLNS